MSKIQKYINYIADPRARRSIRSLFSHFMNDDESKTFKPIVFGAGTTIITMSGAFTTGISISGDGTTAISVTSGFSGTNILSLAGSASGSGVLISGACATPLNITGAFTTAVTIAADGTTAISVTNAFSGATGISLAGTGSSAGINISGNHTTAITIGAQTTAGISITGATATGIGITGSCSTAAIQIGVSGTPAGDILWYGTTAGYFVRFDADGDTNGAVYFGADTKGLDVKMFGATTGAYMLWDKSADKVIFDKADILMGDTDFINFGDSNDVTINWDGTNFEIEALTSATPMKIGITPATIDITHNGTYTNGVDGTGWDVKFFGDTSGAYTLWDASEDQLAVVGPADVPGLKLDGAGSKWASAGYTQAGATWTSAATPAFVFAQKYMRVQVSGATYRVPIFADV